MFGDAPIDIGRMYSAWRSPAPALEPHPAGGKPVLGGSRIARPVQVRIGIVIGEKYDPGIGYEFRAPITNRLIGGERHHPEARMRQSEALGC